MHTLRHEPFILVVGDFLIFYLALWLTLFVRNASLPAEELWWQHAVPFGFIFCASALIYFIVGLYDRHTLIVRQQLPIRIFAGQIATVLVAATFFFFIPYFGITPKTNLAIFLVISSMLVTLWRMGWGRSPRVGRATHAMLLGSGHEVRELEHELNKNPRYQLHIVTHASPADVVVSRALQDQLLAHIVEKNIGVVIADTRNPHMREIIPVLYNLLFIRHDLAVLDAMRLYENIFRRIPVSMLEEAWFVEHITRGGYVLRNAVHRLIDIVAGCVIGVVWLIALPFVWFAVRREDGGPLYVEQIRVGQHNHPIRIRKFRTMSGSDDGNKVLKSTLKVTRVGKILRPTRIDELPQWLNIVRGDLSLIGPRPELPALAILYAEQIPYYRARHLIKPGLTGWAQLYHDAHPHHGADVEETRNKLSYDLYYLKHRSIPLDIEIALKTIKKVLTRAGA